MILLKFENVVKLHTKMINATGGATGIRDESILKSSILNAHTTFDGKDLYPTIEEKSANICFGIIRNHPFVDGNKRMGIYLMLIMLDFSEIILKYEQRELIDLGIGIAKGIYSQSDINRWIKDHIIN